MLRRKASQLESNQCGIETSETAYALIAESALESNQCGIETINPVARTVDSSKSLESNQCGIETSYDQVPHGVRSTGLNRTNVELKLVKEPPL